MVYERILTFRRLEIHHKRYIIISWENIQYFSAKAFTFRQRQPYKGLTNFSMRNPTAENGSIYFERRKNIIFGKCAFENISSPRRIFHMNSVIYKIICTYVCTYIILVCRLVQLEFDYLKICNQLFDYSQFILYYIYVYIPFLREVLDGYDALTISSLAR